MPGTKMSTKHFIFHLGIVLHHVFVLYYFAAKLGKGKVPVDLEWTHGLEKYWSRFLTIWNFEIQTFHFALCVAQDVLELQSNSYLQQVKHYVRKVNNYTFRTFVFPLSLIVTLVFWTIYSIDRELILPKALDAFLPLWLNHALHTNITVAAFTEMLVTFHWYPASRRTTVYGIAAITVAYGVCFFSTYYYDGRWLYPIYGVLDWTQRICFSVVIFIAWILMSLFGEYLNSQIWGHEIQKMKAKDLSKQKKHR
ncbi:androgen-dependent TFPI-regulating protein-like isoform X1 [Schistocerca serialis cubense]|uniref:androgen-dependent TFPI-regulating protein-like isoform X1 n=1 Tax=Schistocerca serialis cubense TaxID=2023355 RepID=UPI00214F21D1|nr:androgen-dependent TFPI-regulating protein-like isoform X1 [Schistocerca serialis cubense]